jgi:hypothetical protein
LTDNIQSLLSFRLLNNFSWEKLLSELEEIRFELLAEWREQQQQKKKNQVHIRKKLKIAIAFSRSLLLDLMPSVQKHIPHIFNLVNEANKVNSEIHVDFMGTTARERMMLEHVAPCCYSIEF